MAAWAASGAIGGAVSGALSGGLAATEVLGIGRIAGGARVTFGHGARHLAGTGIPQVEVEAAIRSQVQSIARGASATGSFWGKVVVRGQKIFYRAFTRPDGSIHVGTYTVGSP